MSEGNRSSVKGKAESELLVHFHLPPGVHELDAFVLHRCEGEFLALLKEIGRQLEVPFEVEVQAYGEGGLKVLLKLVGSHAAALSLIGGTAAGIYTAVDWYSYKRPLQQQQIDRNTFELDRDKRLAEQQIEQNELNLKRARIELKKLEQEASPTAPTMPETNASKPLPLEPTPQPEDVIPALICQRKIVRHRSRFYEQLLEYDKVTQVGFAQSHHPTVAEEIVVARQHFAGYVVTLDEIAPTTLLMTPLEIVSPVLGRGTYKWRGILDKKVISFEIQDQSFLTRVATRKVKFQTGTTLVCDIEVKPRETESGETDRPCYTVLTVHRHFNKGAVTLVRQFLRESVEAAAISEPKELQEKLDLRLAEDH